MSGTGAGLALATARDFLITELVFIIRGMKTLPNLHQLSAHQLRTLAAQLLVQVEEKDQRNYPVNTSYQPHLSVNN
ncbi:hypothetical protein THMIRHAS_15200 [Thiosulfatimonas sediminis]|uniref:Uncharacterized protein n=1 Tax=Thiosulfatimonas sediminis TaxID=2675054 RepID=A0A6F8PVT0_9GAMM|nr:hypothetical protein THMIRHAS_15200 [Thiosulfatimonas sediminis]